MRRLKLFSLIILLLPVSSYTYKIKENSLVEVGEKAIVCQSANVGQSNSLHTTFSEQFTEYFSSLFNTESWPARWYCGEWSAFHGWFYIGSDFLIWVSYFTIPCILFFFLYKRKESLPFRGIFIYFIGFILLCGLTHLIDVFIFWWPAYRLSALIRFGTAAVSIGTIFALVKVIPRALELKSPDILEKIVEERTAELVKLNAKYEEEISERKNAENEVKRLNKALTDFKQAITDSSIMSLTDKKGTITYVNNNFIEISGYSEEELLGENHRIINSGYHDRAFWINMWRTISKGQTWRDEVKNRTKDGSYYWVDTFIMPFKDEKNRINQYLSIRNDITARKQVEKELRELNNTLELRVEEKTKDIQTYNDQLTKINEELESFTYSVSHDLRAPLRYIHGHAKILEEDYASKLDVEGNEILQVIMNNTQKMGQLIDDLLDFSRLGRKEMIHDKCNMEQIVRSIIQDQFAQEKNENTEVNIKKIHPAKADYNMIKQVWVNLISNAFKYSRKKNKTYVEIGSDDLGNEICYYVEDNGVGFDPTYKHKLFGVFQRLHKVEEFEGTGVGLAIVHRIITRHNGKVWADAKKDIGAKFYFTLPK